MQDCTESKSAIAHLYRQIELECEAMSLALSGYATVARHDIIAHRHAMLNSYHEQLAHLVGKKMALEISVAIYDQATRSETTPEYGLHQCETECNWKAEQKKPAIP